MVGENDAQVLVKFEGLNVGGSIKTRTAYNMILKGEKEGYITKDTIIGDLLDFNMEVAPFFLEIGMHCLGCPASRSETIEEACAVHGTNADELVEKLNAHFAAKA
jgi:hybrid cluster-associated redox disulfide protein